MVPVFPARVFLFLIVSIPIAISGRAQISPGADTSKSVKKIIFPVVVYSPETQLGIGGLGVLLWHPKRSKTVYTRTSNAELALLYTTKNQSILLPRYTIFTWAEKYYFEGIVELLLNFPEYYYGIGSETPITNQEVVDYQLIGWESKWMRKVIHSQKIFFGLETRYFKRGDINIRPGGLLETEKPTGYLGYTAVGVGPTLTWDLRDNVVNPGKGIYLDLRAAFHDKILGGNVIYRRYLFDFRKYFNLMPSKRQILAIQAFGNFVVGNAPFKELAELGGPRIMRGYYRGRYRDNYLLSLQAEYRVPVYKWFGVVAFAGIGQVSDKKDPSFDEFKTSYGAGLRVMINKKENLNLRLDYGRGDKDRNGFFYLGFSESF